VVPNLPLIKIPGLEQMTTQITSPTKKPSSKDSEVLAKKIPGSLQLGKFYNNYIPNHEIQTSVLGEPYMY
jgi:hypothetical protein